VNVIDEKAAAAARTLSSLASVAFMTAHAHG